MSYETLIYSVNGRIATISLNRPEKFNNIRPPMPDDIHNALSEANHDPDVRVIILQGEGDSFCAGFDFSDGLEQYGAWSIGTSDNVFEGGDSHWNPGADFMTTTSPFHGPIPRFMSIWRSPKPVITKIHGWCVGGGSEMGLLGDIVIASEDAQIGTPYSRVWGCHLTGMWIYRLGLTRAKEYALTGNSISGKEAADIGLINHAVLLEELDDYVQAYAEKMAGIPVEQLAAMKLIVNQAFDNMGLQTTQTMGVMMDGMMRNIPAGREFIRKAKAEGVGAVVADRDGPFEDYSQGGKDRKPRRKSEL